MTRMMNDVAIKVTECNNGCSTILNYFLTKKVEIFLSFFFFKSFFAAVLTLLFSLTTFFSTLRAATNMAAVNCSL
jgi:hypothetical protein